MLEQETVDSFLPPYEPAAYMTTKKPLAFGCYAPPHIYMEFRVAMQQAMERARKVMLDVFKEWGEVTGRDWGGHIVVDYPDSKIFVVAMGSVVGLLRKVVEELRGEGMSVGLIKIRTFRPFPVEELREALKDAEKVIVLDRSVSFGYEGQFRLSSSQPSMATLQQKYTPLQWDLVGGTCPRTSLRRSSEMWQRQREAWVCVQGPP